MAVKTAQQAHSDTTQIMARVFSAPKPWWTVAPLVVTCLLSGLLVDPSAGGLLVYGVLVFTIPALLGSLLTKPLAEVLGGRTYLRRTVLLSLVTQFLALGVLGVGVLVVLLGAPIPRDRLVLLALASSVWLRQVVLSSTSQSHPGKNLPSILGQPLLGVAFLLLFVPSSATPVNLLLTAALFVVFLLCAVAFTEVANRPLKTSFGVSGLRLMRHFLDHVTEAEGEGQEEIEAFFASFSTLHSVHVAVLGVHGAKGVKAALVLPSIHPGPFGTTAGSDLPAKLRRDLADLTPNLLVPHAPSTHDQNPATTAECRKIAARARELLTAARPSAEGGPLVRAQVGEATATAQRLGDAVLVTASLAPNPTDDIDAATGYAATLAAREAGGKEVLLVDAHNSLAVGSGWVVFGTRQSRDLIEATRRAVAQAMQSASVPLRIGYAERPAPGRAMEGLGAQGLQAVAVEAGGQRVVYLLIDGNNMVPGLRGEIRKALAGLVAECEVLTTDNHSVNVALGGFNPVGAHLDHAEVVGMAREVVSRALEDLEGVRVAAASGLAEDVLLWGHESTTRLSTGINSTVAVLRITAAVSLALAFSLSALGLLLAG